MVPINAFWASVCWERTVPPPLNLEHTGMWIFQLDIERISRRVHKTRCCCDAWEQTIMSKNAWLCSFYTHVRYALLVCFLAVGIYLHTRFFPLLYLTLRHLSVVPSLPSLPPETAIIFWGYLSGPITGPCTLLLSWSPLVSCFSLYIIYSPVSASQEHNKRYLVAQV